VCQLQTKAVWLNIDAHALQDTGAMSCSISDEMVRRAFDVTSHAKAAASVTGHPGPGSLPDEDGTAWSRIWPNQGMSQSAKRQQTVAVAVV
jgi:nicotinamide mononucleotide (NMN) deamidase PncC